MSINNNNNNNPSTTIACFLDLPSGSALSIDGIIVSIQRDDFVGISQIPMQQQQQPFHFITITAKSSSLTTGFVLWPPPNDDTSTALIRRYDPGTEEVSATLVVDDTTTTHLLQQVPALEQQQRIVPYHLLVNTEQQTKWHHSLTNFISHDLLQQRGIHISGQKVVPGCLEDDSTDIINTTHVKPKPPPPDGTSLSFFPVPILDPRRPRRWTSHVGTQRFLQTLLASEKTLLFVDEHPSQRAWERLFATHYQNNWEWVLGDVQLSFLFFVHLHCFESLMHWRDLLSLLGQLKNPSRSLIPVLMHQLSNLDASDVFSTSMDDDDEEEENSIATALQRLVQTWRQQPGPANNDDEASLQHLSNLIQDRLCPRIHSVPNNSEADEDDDFDDNDKEREHDLADDNNDDDDDDSEGPMIVATDDYEAALQRNQQSNRAPSRIYYTPEIAQTYPILWAAKQEHEDLVMTCARALEEANDVSLVRQAADYLQQVEAKSVPF